ITAVATDDKGASTTSAAIAISVAPLSTSADASQRDAARFLTQATFGPRNLAEIDALRTQGYAAWLQSQFALSANSQVQYVNDRNAAGDKPTEERAYE